ncbi:protein CHUP1, chloroplastic-like isoform X2 [Hibiscus syriacus]|uniref:protein CHUP1, chloroplastic-like isoform X2 n=1 Tax=Hibiscus syriacus TaxID=106335 RepID=UPI0019229BD5|nr:protein CHUP1, chloroplastic-like isoform X2 [Hibiscus syriacus]
MSREKRGLRSILLKFGVVVAISSAGLLYARIRTRKTKRHLPSPTLSRRVSDCCSEEVGDCAEADVSDLRMAPASGPKEISAEKDDDDELEIKRLRKMVRMLEERERNLEVQMLEYYSLKEQEAKVLELQNQLRENNMEAKLFTLKIASLQSENQRLENQVAHHSKVAAELQAAKSRIIVLKKKLRHESEQNREHILNVQKRVAKLQEELKAPVDNSDIESKLKRLKDLEGEAEELWKSNTRLQIENSELARKLESTQIQANSVLESEVINKKQERLMLENEELKKQIEQLQEDRCSDAEELVYLQWVNACLRYELRNFPPIPGKTVARDLSKTLNPESEEKAKKLILEYAHTQETGDRGTDFDFDHWSAFYGSDNGQVDDSTTFGNSPAKKTPNSRKTKFLNKLGRLILGKVGSASSRKSAADSPAWSSGRGIDFVNMVQSKSDRWFATPSDTSSSATFDVDQVKAVDKFRRNSDLGFYGYRRFGSARDDALEPQLHQGFYSHQRSDVMKFAEALKQSGTERRQIHKRASSIM